jgi:hypothetical protein
MNLKQLFCRHVYFEKNRTLLSDGKFFDKDMDVYYQYSFLVKEHCVLCNKKRTRVKTVRSFKGLERL